MGKFKDLTGQRFGELVVVEPTNRRDGTAIMWHCICSCGQHVLVRSQSLNVGHTRSCGHLVTENINKVRKEAYEEGTDLNMIRYRSPRADNTSGTRGVTWNKHRCKWVAFLTVKSERKLYKYFTNKQDAIDARKEAEKKYFDPVLKKYGKTATV